MLCRPIHFLLLLLLAPPFLPSSTLYAETKPADVDPTWTTNHTPFRIAGNLYYVGSDDLAAYLVATPKGLILINENLASSPPQIRRSIEALGFRFADVKILLNSQAHYDHVAGLAAIARETHAKVEVMEGDVDAIESGGTKDFAYAGRADFHFQPVKVERVLHDGDLVELGGTTLTAHRTAGHTRGCTTWTMTETEAGHPYRVVIVGGTAVNPGYNLLSDPNYPRQFEDYEKTFATLAALPADIFLGAHGLYFNLKGKYSQGNVLEINAFVDPEGYKAFVEHSRKDFELELARQRRASGR